MRRLLISFSGGETSAMLAVMLRYAPGYDDVKVCFANTGQENEETLQFVDRCDKTFGLGVIWLEAEVREGRQSSIGRQVTFETASRDGRPFEDVIKKYGIPNQAYPHCTRELKDNAIHNYLASIGWEKGSFDTAIGIRADEMDRQAANAEKRRLVYPLIKQGVTKPMVNAFWRNQPFRLGLKGYQGNCSWCWKKSNRKHFTLVWERPEIYAFPMEMERLYGLAGHNEDGTPRVFFRGNRSTADLFRDAAAARGAVAPAEDDATIYDYDLDSPDGCSDSCEAFA